jgi:hypothetical protein
VVLHSAKQPDLNIVRLTTAFINFEVIEQLDGGVRLNREVA